jgi:hypothetical protein
VPFGDALSRVQNRGDRVRTGFPTIDENFAGGPWPGSLTAIQGGPFTGKTLIASQMCLEMAKTCAVGMLFADEGLPGSVIRIGQQLGADKAKLESGDKAETRIVMEELERREIHLINPDEREATVETFFEQLYKRATPGKRLVALLDSIQVLHTDGMTPRMNETERVQLTMAVARKHSLRLGAVSLAIAKMARSGYRNKRDEDNAEPMASSRSSSDVEYGTEAILSLHGNPESKLELRCVKNRFGTQRATFSVPLSLDFQRARLYELDQALAIAEKETARDTRRASVISKIKERIRKELKKESAGMTKATLRQTVTGSSKDVLQAIDEMYEASELFHEESDKKAGVRVWKLCQ